jgi:hypothetical protein
MPCAKRGQIVHENYPTPQASSNLLSEASRAGRRAPPVSSLDSSQVCVQREELVPSRLWSRAHTFCYAQDLVSSVPLRSVSLCCTGSARGSSYCGDRQIIDRPGGRSQRKMLRACHGGLVRNGDLGLRGKEIIITDPSLGMCAFHSARILARMVLSPLGDYPRAQIISRLEGCYGVLETPATYFPTTAILRGALLELIYKTKETFDGSVDDGSRMLCEQSESREVTPPTSQSAGQAGALSFESHAVFSRYSLVDDIRKMTFPPEPAGLPSQSSEGSFEIEHTEHDSASTSSRRSNHGVLLASPSQPLNLQDDVVLDAESAGFNYSNDANYSFDMFMTFGFDPSLGFGQPGIPINPIDSFGPSAYS